MNYIFVLAGGLNKEEVNDFVKKRLDKAIELYNSIDNAKIICVGGGTYHKKTPLDINNYIIYESSACAKYLISKNVNENDVYREWASFDTIGNGLFSFLNFIIPLKIKHFHLVTSDFHMERASVLFLYFNKLFSTNCKITLVKCDDTVIPKKTLEIRIERERNTLKNYKNGFFNIKDKFDF